MVLPALLVDRFHQRGDRLGRCELRDAVPEVEHMTVSLAKVGQDLFDLRPDGLRWRKQRHGIQIALQGDASSGYGSRFREARGPVKPDGIATGADDVLDPWPSALGEHDIGDAYTVPFARQ